MLKICGVVNDIDEAKEFEEIVKVFLIKQRINNLSSGNKNKDFKNTNLNFIKKLTENNSILEKSKEKKFNVKNNS